MNKNMQNEPNFPSTPKILTPFLTGNYMKYDASPPPKNKPNTKPIKANLQNAQNQHNLIFYKQLHEKMAFSAQKKRTQFKPKTNPILPPKQGLRGGYTACLRFGSIYIYCRISLLHNTGCPSSWPTAGIPHFKFFTGGYCLRFGTIFTYCTFLIAASGSTPPTLAKTRKIKLLTFPSLLQV